MPFGIVAYAFMLSVVGQPLSKQLYIDQLKSGDYKRRVNKQRLHVVFSGHGCTWAGYKREKQGYLFSENLFKAPKRKDCNDVILAAVRQEPGIL